MNRDELDERPASRPPVSQRIGNQTHLRTVDAQAGGAWIGANDAGLIVCLLNRTVTGDMMPLSPNRRSRGDVVPHMLMAQQLDTIHVFLAELPLTELAPFTLVAVDLTALRVFAWNGRHLHEVPGSPVQCSSGVGDERVAPVRLAAWHACTETGVSPNTQDAWHDSQIGTDSAAWVRMIRSGAHTVSRTVIEVNAEQVHLAETRFDAVGNSRDYHRCSCPRIRAVA